MRLNLLKVIVLSIIVAGCANYKVHNNNNTPTETATNSKVNYTVYLFGDGGKPELNGEDKNLAMLKAMTEKEGENSSVIFLGDNIYQRGMPNEDAPDRKLMEDRIKAQMDAVKDFKGKIMVIPGNHDWAQGRPQGWENLKNQEKFVEEYLGRGNVFLPDNGCPGPVEIELANDIVVIIVDSHWWLHTRNKPNKEGDCEIVTQQDLILGIQDALRRNKDKKIIFSAHHPLYSYGNHGGYYTLKDHFFPLVAASKHLYIPLPILGSIQPVVRKYFGNLQDISHTQYQTFKRLIEEQLAPYDNVMYVAGHEHALQYIPKNGVHHIISGGGCKKSPVANGKDLAFGYGAVGIGKLVFFEDGAVHLQFWVPTGGGKGEMIFSQHLFSKKYEKPLDIEHVKPDYSDSMVTTSISDKYIKGSFTRFLMGDNYRDVWNTQVPFEVFDIDKAEGGLTILKRGGGQQTRSIRMETKDGRQFVLRSVEKYTEKAIPVYLQNTFAADVVQDQISASNPYAALTIPVLADAVGVYHTNPKLVYVPNDHRLGIYREDIADGVFLYEERPEKGNKNSVSFGRPDKIKSTFDVLEKTQDKQSHKVDQMFVLRSRLFDIFINDWDRHDDQWRWAVFEYNDSTIYRPIPRDRDQAFFVNEGLIPSIASKKWAVWKTQNFQPMTDDVVGLSFNARFFDRTFLTQPDLNDWLAMADTITTAMTDEVIDRAMKKMPEQIQALIGNHIATTLKERRKYMRTMAEILYKSLAEEVDVVGTNNSEYFEVTRVSNEETKVTVYDLGKKDREKKEILYQRIFKTSETKEIHLYGLKGDDVFNISGDVNKSILVRIIGGGGEDAVQEMSHVSGWGKKSIVYDKPKGMKIESHGELKNRTANDDAVNTYDRKAFRYNVTTPRLGFGYNVDDGIFVGLGFNYTTHGFRKEPFKSQHKFRGRYAVRTGAYNFDYSSEFTQLFGKYNLYIGAEVYAPNYLANFFGLGNSREVLLEDDLGYNRVRMSQMYGTVALTKAIKDKHKFKLGIAAQHTELDKNIVGDGRFITDFSKNGLDSANVFTDKVYGIVYAGYRFDNRDNKLMPTRGADISMDVEAFNGLDDNSGDFQRMKADIKLYYTKSKFSRTVFAFRFGGAKNYGDYEFFQANTLSGYDNLRGYRRDRFSGTGSLYQNTEARIKLGGVRNYLLKGTIGLLAFHDAGRVWYDDEDSKEWHNGYGGGIWLSPFEQAVVNTTYGISGEEEWFYFTFSYLF